MAKRDKLYTVNRWNSPNLFFTGGDTYNLSQADYKANPWNYTQDYLYGNGPSIEQQYVKNNSKPSAGQAMGSIGMGMASAIPDKLLDVADPLYYLANGKESKAGKTLQSAGKSVFKASAQSGQPWGMLAGAALQVFGDFANAGWGYKKDEKKIGEIEGNAASKLRNANYLAGASTSDALMNAASNMSGLTSYTPKDLVKGGWFVKGKARRKGQKILNKDANAFAVQNSSLDLGAKNVDSNLDEMALYNYAAFGGPFDVLDNNTGAINYGFMNDYLTTKRMQANTAQNKVPGMVALPSENLFANGGIEIKHPGRLTALKERTGKTEAELWAEGRPEVRKMITFARNARKWKHSDGGPIFALGGDLQTHGGDYSTGLSQIMAGDTHESNPYEGVQVGIDSQGTPNLVEEGETIFNDYVYSNRIELDDTAKKAFHISKKRNLTYADLSKSLEKEAAERPNDPISIAALKAQMADLAEQQERQKAEMEVQRAKEAFEAMSPEEQVAIMQQVSQEDQAAQQAIAQEAAQQQAMQQQPVISQEEIIPEEETIPQEQPVMQACGGKVNRFADGGAMEWLEKNHPDEANKEIIAKYLDSLVSHKTVKYEDANGNIVEKKIPSNNASTLYATAYRDILNGKGNLKSPRDYARFKGGQYSSFNDRRTKHFKFLTDTVGLPKEVAFEMAFPAISKKDFVRTGMSNVPGLIYSDELGAEYNRPAYLNASNYRDTAYRRLVGSEPLKADVASVATPTAQQPQPQAVEVPAERNDSIPVNAQTQEPVAIQAPIQVSTVPTTVNQAVQAARQAAPQAGSSGIIPYGYYLNGSDGISVPTGFKVGERGRAYDYTDEYKNLVNSLGADDIRAWAAQHPNDVSLQSFIARGNNLDTLTDEQWRKGALDGKYGFMHHVADQMLNTPEPAPADAVQNTATRVPVADAGVYNKYYILGEDGAEPEEVNEDAVKDLIFQRTDKGAANDNGILYSHYYKRPPVNTTRVGVEPGYIKNTALVPEASDVSADNNTEDTGDVKPNYRPEWLRYAGIFGPAVGLGMMAAGVGKPNYKDLDAALEMANKGTAAAAYQPIGNYMTYRPMDIWTEQNRMNAAARATDRALLNSGAVQGTKMAGLIANGYNNQVANGQLYRQALEYNDALNKQVQDFNRGTDQFNAEAFNRVSLTNAELANRDKNFRAQLAMQAANQKLDSNADWYNSLYGNVSGLFRGIADIGRENALHNMIAGMWADGVGGNATEETNSARGMLKKKKKTNGGKIKRKGLTF